MNQRTIYVRWWSRKKNAVCSHFEERKNRLEFVFFFCFISSLFVWCARYVWLFRCVYIFSVSRESVCLYIWFYFFICHSCSFEILSSFGSWFSLSLSAYSRTHICHCLYVYIALIISFGKSVYDYYSIFFAPFTHKLVWQILSHYKKYCHIKIPIQIFVCVCVFNLIEFERERDRDGGHRCAYGHIFYSQLPLPWKLTFALSIWG